MYYLFFTCCFRKRGNITKKKVLYDYAAKVGTAIFVFCVVLLKIIPTVPENASGYCRNTASAHTAQSGNEEQLSWEYDDTVYNDSKTCQTVLPVKCNCGNGKISVCHRKGPLHRDTGAFLNGAVQQNPFTVLMFAVSAERCKSAVYDITKCYERFLS